MLRIGIGSQEVLKEVSCFLKKFHLNQILTQPTLKNPIISFYVYWHEIRNINIYMWKIEFLINKLRQKSIILLDKLPKIQE